MHFSNPSEIKGAGIDEIVQPSVFSSVQFRVDDLKKVIHDQNLNEELIVSLFKTSDGSDNNAKKIPQEILFMDWNFDMSFTYSQFASDEEVKIDSEDAEDEQ